MPDFNRHPLAYCLNVHPTPTWEALLENVAKAGQVRQLRHAFPGMHTPAGQSQDSCGAEMGVGMWIPAELLSTARQPARISELKSTLEQHRLRPFTLNGFPFGNFHQPVVKHDVYRPTWADARRAGYTLELFQLLDDLLPADVEGSISTVPLAWPDPSWFDDGQTPRGFRWLNAAGREFARHCSQNLQRIVDWLAELEQRTTRYRYLCLEPEPGCLLGTSEDLCDFFEMWFDGTLGGEPQTAIQQARLRRYLRVCHDVCHAEVVRESQVAALENYRRLGLTLGKVQLSSAPMLPLDMLPGEAASAVDELKQFIEPRYLHQTHDGHQLHEDLPLAFEHWGWGQSEAAPLAAESAAQPWVVHFHVPIFLKQIGRLQTTQTAIIECCQALAGDDQLQHIEVETYAWNVLPQRQQFGSLEQGIAQEMDWACQVLDPAGHPRGNDVPRSTG